MTATRDPEFLLPLTPAMLHVLLALADEDRHGYAIIKDVEAQLRGRSIWALERSMASSRNSSLTGSFRSRGAARRSLKTMNGGGTTG